MKDIILFKNKKKHKLSTVYHEHQQKNAPSLTSKTFISIIKLAKLCNKNRTINMYFTSASKQTSKQANGI